VGGGEHQRDPWRHGANENRRYRRGGTSCAYTGRALDNGARGSPAGDTRQEAIDNIQEAIAGYPESLAEHEEPIPPSIHEEIAPCSFSNDVTS
jgi:hypothetical protein